MSDNIPLELQVEIIKRVPVKPLLQFRSVSKEWKALIDSPNFAADYCLRQSHPHRLLIRYTDIEETDQNINSILNDLVKGLNFPKYKFVLVADDTFHQQQIPTAAIPKSLNNLIGSQIVGCCHGLVCFYGYNNRDISPMVVVWNPWIRKFVDVPVPNVLIDPYYTVIGFGVSLQTKDLKIVKINSFLGTEVDTSVPIPWRVEVFTLSSRTWKCPPCGGNNLPCRDSIRLRWGQVALDGVIYWLAFEWIKVAGDFVGRNLIMSFDLSSEGFQEVCLPDNLARLDRSKISISKRMESVVVLEMGETLTSCGVWMMGQGATKSFTRLFNVMTRGSSPFCRLRGFMKNGEPIVDHGSDALFACDTYSGRIKDLGIVGKSLCFFVMSYMETLLLMDK